MTAVEYQTEFSMWAISASPLVVTTPIMNCSTDSSANVTCKGWISDLQKRILLNKEVIAINQQETPQGRPIKDRDQTVWARAMDNGDVAVALYNAEDSNVELHVDFAAVNKSLHNGWSSTTAVTVRDLWLSKDLGTFTGQYPKGSDTVSVAPHAAVLLRMAAASA